MEGKFIFLAKAFYLNKDKITVSTGAAIFSIVHAYGVS
jgi:hypothetical protein